MSSPAPAQFESEPQELVEEFVRRDLISPDVAQEAEQLVADGDGQEALEVILAARRGYQIRTPSR